MQCLKNTSITARTRTFLGPPSLTSSFVRPSFLLTQQTFRSSKFTTRQSHLVSSTPLSRMSFSNADTGDKPADPYKEKNLTSPDLKTKVEDLVKFMESCKFGMMTTRIESSGLLTSRCMALAAKAGRSRLPLLSTIFLTSLIVND